VNNQDEAHKYHQLIAMATKTTYSHYKTTTHTKTTNIPGVDLTFTNYNIGPFLDQTKNFTIIN